MDVSAISGYSTTINLINALSPISGVTAASGLNSVLSPASAQTSISTLGYLLNASEALATAAGVLAAPGALAARQASTTDPKVATAAASAATPTGAYNVQVTQLAQAQTLTTPPQASSLTAIGNGQPTTLTFQFASGASRTVSLDSGDNTLAGIASAINAAGIGIQARITRNEGGYQLSLTGQTGAANAFTIGASGDTEIAGLLAYPPGGGGPNRTTLAQDAQGLVNGTAFTASTNTVNTAVPGLTLDVAGIGNATLTVAANSEQTRTVSAFVDAYNAVQSGLGSLGSDNPTLALSTFFLRDQLAGALDTGLAQIGITANANGTLTLDSAKFQAALNADPGSVGRVFSNGGKGVAEQVAGLTSGSLSPANLLQLAAPVLNSPANLARTVQSSLLSSVLDQTVLATNLTGSANLADTGGQAFGQSNDSLLAQLLSRSRTLTQDLTTLGTQLNLAGLL